MTAGKFPADIRGVPLRPRFESREAAQEFSPGWSRKAVPWVSILNEDKP